jgi:hypothetical protein
MAYCRVVGAYSRRKKTHSTSRATSPLLAVQLKKPEAPAEPSVTLPIGYA